MPIDFFGGIDGEWLDGWFATPGMAVLDTIRVLILAATLAFIYFSSVAVFRAHSRTQRALLTANVASGFLVVGVTYERFGDPATYWFPIAMVIAGCGLWGSWGYLYGPN